MMAGWHSHAPRRSHEQNAAAAATADAASQQHRPVSPAASTDSEPRRRSSSDATPRPTPASTRFLADQDAGRATSLASDVFAPSKRLGFFADKLSSSLSTNPKNPTLLHPPVQSATAPSSSTPPAPMSNVSKSSPSKASYGRTYDSKLVSREMHRLGNLAHLPSALAPQLSTAPSATSLALPTPPQVSISSSSTADPWGALHVHVLPLFNGEPLRIPIEDLNVLVKRHIQAVVTSSPSKALATLDHDASELIASGMVTLNAKLMGIDDEKLVSRVVEIWRFFWDQVLTYVEGVLLPLQTDPLLSSLYRTPKSLHRPSSPTRQNSKNSISTSLTSQLSTSYIDVRTVALTSFRDKVILPLFTRLFTRLSMPNGQDSYEDMSANQQPRLQQMLLVLTSQSRQRLPTFSLTSPAPQPTAGEAAISDLLRIVRAPQPQFDARSPAFKSPMSPLSRAPSFLSGGLPRDRRGRIAQKQSLSGIVVGEVGEEDSMFGEETPRNGQANLIDVEREREREFLEALRSPDPESSAARASVGGWGLGEGHEDVGRSTEEEEEDEPLDWDEAQAVVERMVGMNSQPPENRRRMT